MNLLRLLMLAAAAYAVWRLLKISSRTPLPPSQDEPRDRGQDPQQYEAMARCASCGTHLPARSLSRSGRCGRCSG